jgi:Family of unknown function (DUF6152)
LRHIDTVGRLRIAAARRCFSAARKPRPQRIAGLALVAAAALLAPLLPAFAHHSYAMFDAQKQVDVHGTLKEFHWTNPHSWLVLAVRDGSGNYSDVNIECPPVSALLRMGWRPANLQPGDVVTVTISPLRDGSPGGSLVKIVLADGRELSAMPKPPDTNAPPRGATP